MIFIIPEKTKLIIKCFQLHNVNVLHNLMYTIISATRRFVVQRKYFIVKGCNYVSVDGSHLFLCIKSAIVKQLKHREACIVQ